jgi:ribose transport system permease protein
MQCTLPWKVFPMADQLDSIAAQRPAGPAEAGPATSKGRLRRAVGQVTGSRNAALLLVIVLLYAYISIRQPHFRTLANLRLQAVQMTTIGIPALGMTLLMIAGYVDLSIGSLFSMLAVFATQVGHGAGIVWAVIFAVALGAAVGGLNGVLVWRIRISPLIVTLAGLTLYQGVVDVVTQGQGVNDFAASFGRLGQGTLVPGIPDPLLLFLVLAVLCAVFLSRTSTGLNIFALGGNRDAAALVGVRIRNLSIGLFAINGAIIGIAAILNASTFGGSTPVVGTGLELNVITAVILGGVSFAGGEGGVIGTVLAVALLTIVNSGIVALNINTYYADVVSGALLLTAVGLDQLTEEHRDRYRRLLAMRQATIDSERK